MMLGSIRRSQPNLFVIRHNNLGEYLQVECSQIARHPVNREPLSKRQLAHIKAWFELYQYDGSDRACLATQSDGYFCVVTR